MALSDDHLLKLLLIFSALHRAKLLGQREPAARIAVWVQDIFPYLRHALNDPHRLISNTTLTTAIILSTLEIVFPKAFGVVIPWQQHLIISWNVLMARDYHTFTDETSRFLRSWVAYLDILRSLTGGKSTNDNFAIYDKGRDDPYISDCVLGITPRCAYILFHVAQLLWTRDFERCWNIDGLSLRLSVLTQAYNLVAELHAAKADDRTQICSRISPDTERRIHRHHAEMAAINYLYHLAGIIQVLRHVRGDPPSHPDVQWAYLEAFKTIGQFPPNYRFNARMVFPMFIVGCEAQSYNHRLGIIQRLDNIEDIGVAGAQDAKAFMQKVWDKG